MTTATPIHIDEREDAQTDRYPDIQTAIKTDV